MMHVDFDQIDDPRFDLSTAEIIGGDFFLQGVVELNDAMVMYDQRPVPTPPSRRVWFSREWWASLKAKEHRVFLVVPNAKGFAGVIPCIVRVTVADDPQMHLFVDEHPLARATPGSGQHS